MKINRILIVLSLLLLFNSCSCNETSNSNVAEIPNIDYVFINSYPHDTNSFTEGFLFHDSLLFESTGATESLNQTRSLFGILDLKTGKIDVKVELNKEKYFGEGIAFLNGKIYQLTYKTKIGFIYDATTYKEVSKFTIPTDEGWGLTTDGKVLIMSDGTNTLTFLNPDNLQVIKKLSINENGYSTNNLNELEYINGYIYANLWTTNYIVKIDPQSGKVLGKLDLSILASEAKNLYANSLEMNGIAYDSITDKIYITGKMWPKVYEIKFNH